jgi:hypothetical protein
MNLFSLFYLLYFVAYLALLHLTLLSSSSSFSSYYFSLWGEAVNLASRMESTGLPGKIHCTKAVVDLVGSDFEFQSRGPVDVKSVGKIETFILTERKRLVPARSVSVRKPRQRRTSLLAESLKTLKSSRELLNQKIEDIQNRMSDRGPDSGDSDSSGASSDARLKVT